MRLFWRPVGHRRFRDCVEGHFAALDAEQTTPSAVCTLLIGPEQLWWECCHEALHHDPAWLKSLRAQQILDFIKATSAAGSGESGRAAATYAAARALCGTPTPQAEPWLDQAMNYWAGAPTPAAIYQGPHARHLTQDLPAEFWPARSGSFSSASTEETGRLLGLVSVLQLAERRRHRRDRVRIAVVFAGSGSDTRGRLAYLELRDARIGVAGIFPDPTSAAHLATDHAFAAAITRAWATIAPRERDRCVLWRLVFVNEHAGPPVAVDAIDGGSLGAAFALALRELTSFPRPVRRPLRAVHGFLHGLRPKTAVTGTLDAAGQLAAVEALDTKADAVRQRGWRLVAPAANATTNAIPRDVVTLARNLGHANQLSRRWNRRHLLISAVVALALTVPPAVVLHISDQRHARQEAHQRDVAIANQLTLRSEAVGNTDPTASKIESLAAWQLNPTPQSQYALISAAVIPGLAILNSGPVHPMAFSPDGRILGTVNGPIVNGNGTVRLWDTATHQPIDHPFVVDGDLVVSSMAFSPDGRTLAIGAYNGPCGCGAVQLWDVATHRPLGQPFASPVGNVDSVAFSPDGRTLAIGTDDGTTVWDVATHRPLGQPFVVSASDLVPVVFSPDGRALAIRDSGGVVQLWDVATRRPTGDPLTGPTDAVTSMAFSPDGRTLATGNYDGTVQMWDTVTHQQISTVPPIHGSVYSVAFSPGGQILAIGDNDGTTLWDTAAHRQLSEPFGGQTGTVYSVAFSPNGQTLATAGLTTTWLWDMTQQASTPLTDHTGSVSPASFGSDEQTMAIGPDGRTLATMNDQGAVRLWDVMTRHQIGQPLVSPNGADSMAFSPDGRTLATVSNHGTGTTWLWDVTRQVGMPFTSDGGGWESVAFSPDGRTLATDTFHGTAQLWDVATRRPLGAPFSSPGAVESLAFSPDGRTLVVGDEFGTVLWDVATHRPVGQPLSPSNSRVSSNIESAVFSPNGRAVATVSLDGTVWLWDVATQQHIGEPLISPGGAKSVAFDPDGQTLATVDHDGTVRLWDVATDQQIGQPFGPSDGVNSAVFSPDGRTLAIGTADGAELWDVTPVSQALAKVCRQIGGYVTQAEWNQYVPAGPSYNRVCP